MGHTLSTGYNRVEQSNRVLLNTYWLLSLTLIPTIAGAWFGMSLDLGPTIAENPFLSFFAFLGIAVALAGNLCYEE